MERMNCLRKLIFEIHSITVATDGVCCCPVVSVKYTDFSSYTYTYTQALLIQKTASTSIVWHCVNRHAHTYTHTPSHTSPLQDGGGDNRAFQFDSITCIKYRIRIEKY